MVLCVFVCNYLLAVGCCCLVVFDALRCGLLFAVARLLVWCSLLFAVCCWRCCLLFVAVGCCLSLLLFVVGRCSLRLLIVVVVHKLGCSCLWSLVFAVVCCCCICMCYNVLFVVCRCCGAVYVAVCC